MRLRRFEPSLRSLVLLFAALVFAAEGRVHATNDETHLQEVMAGANGNSRIQFIVIRQEGAGNLWGPQFGEPQARMALVFFNASGQEVGTFKFPHDAPGPQPAHVLIATHEFATLPGAQAPYFIMPPLVSPLSGKVCFTNNPQGALVFPRTDCLSYGSFSGATGSSIGNGVPVAFGPPAATLPIL